MHAEERKRKKKCFLPKISFLGTLQLGEKQGEKMRKKMKRKVCVNNGTLGTRWQMQAATANMI